MSCKVSQIGLANFTNYFPNLASLSLYKTACLWVNGQIPSIFWPLKKLRVAQLSGDYQRVLSKLLKLGLRVDDVECQSLHEASTPSLFAQQVVGIFGADAKYLRVAGPYSCKYNLSTSGFGESLVIILHQIVRN